MPLIISPAFSAVPTTEEYHHDFLILQLLSIDHYLPCSAGTTLSDDESRAIFAATLFLAPAPQTRWISQRGCELLMECIFRRALQVYRKKIPLLHSSFRSSCRQYD